MASAPKEAGGHKRKAPNSFNVSSTGRKRQRVQDARTIPVQSRDAAVSATGELDVAAFVKAREYEINALEKSMQKARHGLTTRAFQQVPRAMRRRTASHNVKKVPRRLRPRAAREMKEDNTPTVTARRRIPSTKQRLRLENSKRLKALNTHSKTVRQKKKEAKHNKAQTNPEKHVSATRLPRIKKNNLSEPPKATSKFKKRQRYKTWLPTHLWHAKRAHMTKPSEPLWRMAIPISPTEKSYRPSHRASGGRGCIAWDVSYMATISCQGVEASLEGMLKAISFHAEGWFGAKYNKWKNGMRSAQDWVFERDNEKQAIAPVMVLWCPKIPETSRTKATSDAADEPGQDLDIVVAGAPPKPTRKEAKPSNRRLFIRVHPSAFQQLWHLLIKVAKTQRPQVLMEDLRFEIGSIEITGPGSTEALLGVLKPIERADSAENSAGSVWKSLAGLTNPASLPQGALLYFNASDPRLNHPPKQIEIPKDPASAAALTELTVTWPSDNNVTSPDLFSLKARHLASRALPSQKAINRRKTLAPPGQLPSPKDTDVRIPVLLLATRPPASFSGAQGTWTVLLPWKCVGPVWRSLIYYPLSSGGTPRFGGLDEKRQICFEHAEAWFPGDAPATEAGQAWERTECARRFDNWSRRPTSRRVAWETVDLGNGKKGEHGRGWTCDWEFLLSGRAEEPVGGKYDGGNEDQGSAGGASNGKDTDSKPKTQKQRKVAKAKEAEKVGFAEKHIDEPQRTDDDSRMQVDVEEVSDLRTTEAPGTTLAQEPASKSQASSSFVHYPQTLATSCIKSFQTSILPSNPCLFTIRITLLTRGTPSPCARIYRLPPSTTTPAESAVRKQWLDLDTAAPPKSASNRNPKLKKDKLNHRGTQKAHKVYPFESLDYMNYIPPDAPPEFFKTPEYLKAAEAQAAALAVAQKAGSEESPAAVADRTAALVQSLMDPTNGKGEHHPPCPDEGHLIGFVTSGTYNLAEGRGTAVGSVWLQRVVEGWRADGSSLMRGNPNQVERQRRLCVVRNAGEGVGRLGRWELC